MALIVITLLSVVLSALLTTSANSLQIQAQSSHEQQANNELKLSLPTVLPRKLRLFEVKGNGGQDSTAFNRQKKHVTDKSHQEEQVVVHGSIGTWQEWMERADSSQYFTMDYSHVKRRSPIHNKSMPARP